MAEAPAGEESVPSTDREGMECVLVLGDLRELVQELEPITEWFTLGLYLGLKDDELRVIEENHRHLQRCKHEVLSRWLRKGHSCTWRRVVEVLIQMREMVVADTIKLKYLTLTAGPQAASNTVVDAVARRNLIVIKGKWGELVAHTDEVLQDKLDSKEITSYRFRHVLGNLYSCEGKMNGDQFLRKLLKPSASISEMFETMTVEGAWDFMNYYPLECIIEKFGNDSTRKMMERYKRDLTGYTLMTAIKDHLDAVDLEHPTHRILPIPQEKLFCRLSCKVKAKITNHSLKYVRDVWRSLAERFSLPMPALLLHKIAKGCLEITWRIPSVLAAYVIQKAKQSDDYFKEQFFFRVSVDGAHVYTKNEVEVGVEVKGEPLAVTDVKSVFTEDVAKEEYILQSLPHVEQPSMSTATCPLPHVEQPSMSTATCPLPHVEQPSMSTEGDVKRKQMMRWETLGRAPELILKGEIAVDGNTVYVTPGHSHRVWAYDLREDLWTRLPDCPQRDAGLAIVNGLLTAVGGWTNDGNATNTLVSLTESRSKWTEHFPPMPVKLYDTAVVSTGNYLVVLSLIGTRVQVMDTTSLRWFPASSLPEHLLDLSVILSGTELYVQDYITGLVFSCSLPALLRTSFAEQPETTDMWQSLTYPPMRLSTLTTLRGQLVAVGGYDRTYHTSVHHDPTTNIYQYDPLSYTWHIIGHMPTARRNCLVATLPGNTLVVMGGETTGGRPCDVVEVAYPV